jgi:hypothetical protein
MLAWEKEAGDQNVWPALFSAWASRGQTYPKATEQGQSIYLLGDSISIPNDCLRPQLRAGVIFAVQMDTAFSFYPDEARNVHLGVLAKEKEGCDSLLILNPRACC